MFASFGVFVLVGGRVWVGVGVNDVAGVLVLVGFGVSVSVGFAASVWAMAVCMVDSEVLQAERITPKTIIRMKLKYPFIFPFQFQNMLTSVDYWAS